MRTQTLMTEHDMQKSIIAEVNLLARQDPVWNMIFHVPNGGPRTKASGGKLKTEGVRPGVPDLLWPIARGKYIGMAMELKVSPNRLTAAQAEWLHALSAHGWYTCTVRDDPAAAIDMLKWYWEGAS